MTDHADRNQNDSARADDAAPKAFSPVGQYTTPTMPTEHAWAKVRETVLHEDESPVLAGDRLSAATGKVLDEVASPPACGPLIDDLEATLAPWIARKQRTSWLNRIVMPPCDRNHILESWARQKGYTIVEPPERRAAFGTPVNFPPTAASARPLVIPRLERWFLRYHDGLHAIRALLAMVDGLEQPCIIGCNSWAWAYLATATGAGVILPKGLVPQPFDADRLHAWFSKLSEPGKTAAMTFRRASNGQDVLASDSKGARSHRYLKQLAARSLGIPWVAWTMWRESLRSQSDLEALSEAARNAVGDDARAL